MTRMISYSEFADYSKWAPRDRKEAYSFIDQAQRYVENYLNYPLEEAERTEKFEVFRALNGWVLRNQPVREISSLKVNGVEISATSFETKPYGFDYDLQNGDKVTVTYTSGYKPFNYVPTLDERYLPNKVYFNKVGDKYIEILNPSIDEPITDTVYEQESNTAEDALDETVRMVILRLATVLHNQSGGNLGTQGFNTGNMYTNFDNRDIEAYCRPLNGLRSFPI